MPTKLPRSKSQLERTSRNRRAVFDFMEGFNAKHLWTINGPIDCSVDEIMAFATRRGVVIAQTFEIEGWNVYTEPTTSQEIALMRSAMLLQIEETERGSDAPLSAMWVRDLTAPMWKRMSDETIRAVLMDGMNELMRRAGTVVPIDIPITEVPPGAVVIPITGMTPIGFGSEG